jgi:dihydrofolate reductase
MLCSVFIATSLDGYIARPNGGIDWLPEPSGSDADDHGYSAFMDTVDAVVMGRNTYELVLTFGGWHFTKPVVVLSSRSVTIAPELAEKVFHASGTPQEVQAFCAARGWQSLYIDGGVTIQRFLAEGLIDRFIITRVPVIIGSGLPLFAAVPADVRLTHEQTQAYANGLVQSRYRVNK